MPSSSDSRRSAVSTFKFLTFASSGPKIQNSRFEVSRLSYSRSSCREVANTFISPRQSRKAPLLNW
eukprot:5815975-Pleurochrysis_carterae.AAC.1